MYDSGRIGCAIGAASCGELRVAQNARRRRCVSTPREIMSALNSWSRNTVRPSLRDSWNQSRHVTRLPVQLWKYSCAMTPSMAAERPRPSRCPASRAPSRELKMFRDLFSIAPMLKSSTATMLNRSRSYSSPNTSSSHFIALQRLHREVALGRCSSPRRRFAARRRGRASS